MAAAQTPEFVSELAVLLVAGAATAYAGYRLRVMPIVSFLVTGAIVGPHALGLVHNEALIEAAAEVGVVLLLFTIGIEFSLDKLAKIKRIIVIGGGLQVGIVVAAVTGIVIALGADWRAGVFTGFLVALSSTAIVMKLLMNTGEVGSEDGQAALGVLIFQDLAVVGMVLLVPMLGGAEGSPWEVVLALGKGVGIIVVALWIARAIMPRVLEAVARTCSQEIFLLTVVAICIGTAYLTGLAGVSLSLGAFLAGLIVSESRFSQLAFAEILPLQILFSAMFFISVGLLLDMRFVLANPLLIFGVILAVFAIKTAATALGMAVLGYRAGVAASIGVLLAQVGEFSFVLERTGRTVGLSPAGIENGGPETFIAATVALMVLTPFLRPVSHKLGALGTSATAPPAPQQPAEAHGDAHHQTWRDHVIIAGYGPTGRAIARVLHDRDIRHLVLTLSPEGAADAERREQHVIRGNYTRGHELEVAGIWEARLLVVADDDEDTTKRVVEVVHAMNPHLPIVARASSRHGHEELTAAGATIVVLDEVAGSMEVLDRVLSHVGLSATEVRTYRDDLREETGQRAGTQPGEAERGETVSLSAAQRASTECGHAEGTAMVTPSAAGCTDCLKTGDEWVHLRICMTCGHVACCDSSPNQHASKHFAATGHAVVKSMQPGETWAWCYEDERYL